MRTVEEAPSTRTIKVQFRPETLFLAAAADGDEEALLGFLKDGVDPNTRNADGLTALHQVCIVGGASVVLTLS